MTRADTEGDAGLNIYQRLNKVREAVGYIQRERRQGMNYAVVTHDAVIDAVRDEMVKHGILVVIPSMEMSQEATRTDLKCIVRFINCDNPSDQLDVVSAGYGVGNDDKGPGKAFTYAYKGAIQKTLMLYAGEEDPDTHEGNKLRGEADPVFQSIGAFSEKMGALDTHEELTKLADSMKDELAKAAKKYPTEVNNVRAAFAKKLAAVKKKESK